jgi:excisionase family DNA binding protein
MDMVTLEAARRLGVSQRQVQRLAAAGRLAGVRRVGNSLVVDATSVAVWSSQAVRRGRPWTLGIAWAGLWRLSGLETPWITGQSSMRLERRLAHLDARTLAWATRGRATVARFRAPGTALSLIGERLRLTGMSALDQGRDLLAPATDRIEGYATADELATLVDQFFLVPDDLGAVTLRIADHPAVASWVGLMPVAVVGVDLLDSADPRERAAGEHLLDTLLKEGA